MREIKYRVWLEDCETKKLYAIYFDLESISQGSIMGPDSEWHRMFDLRDDIEQFTGICDHEEMEIYEGDGFRRNGHVGYVERSLSGEWVIRFDDGKIISLLADTNYNWKAIDNIIYGSIHEKPELLE